jgi:ribose transport system ATP-binding protein
MRLNTPAKSIRNGIFLVPGDRNIEGLFLSHSIYNNYIFPKIALGKHPLIIPRKKYRAQCQKTVNQLSIAAKSIDSPVSTLSGGNAQKVVIGKWLSFDTKVLLLSDPAKGVDVGVKQDIYELILRMSKEKGMSTVLYASDADELIKYCDRVLIMFEGHFTRELCGEEIKEETVYEAMMSAKLSK